MKLFKYEELASADLIVDAVYEGSKGGQLSGEPISRVLPGSGNMGGFRIAGRGHRKNWVVLYSTGEDPDWPDTLDLNTGQFVYFGDNKRPGHELHDTTAGGNKILRNVFDSLHADHEPRSNIPPFLVFKKYPTVNSARSAQFKGLAVPGFPGLPFTEDLVAVWRATGCERFQNYRAVFTILDIPVVERRWIRELAEGNLTSSNAPQAWVDWLETGRYRPLTAEATTVIRSREEQTPDTTEKLKILHCIWERFKDSPYAFEGFAARIYQMTDSRVVIDEITRGTMDGGRDAVGRYLIGLRSDPLYAEFSLEAKCYRPETSGENPVSVGVKDVSRLISRIRHRQFGVLVTTTFVSKQAYQEVRDDRHPIVIISGKDIVDILINNGINTIEKVDDFLGREFQF